MNGATLLLSGITVYLIGYRFYGRYLSWLAGINPKKKTPAHALNDGIDYVPTKAPVVFGHHFASIAGAGPIIGPVLAACFGWVPVALWIIFGCVFIGAVHDFAALFISVRNNGLSIGHIIEKYISYSGRQIFLFFCFAALTLIVAIFALLISKTFASSPSVATSSVFFITIAVIFGFMVHRGYLSLLVGSIIFVPLLFVGIKIGLNFPLDFVQIFNISTEKARQIWLILLFVYVYVASVAPVWILLQPRDYLNSYLLFAMIILGFFSILFTAPSLNLPAFTGLVVDAPVEGNIQCAIVTVLVGAEFWIKISNATPARQAHI